MVALAAVLVLLGNARWATAQAVEKQPAAEQAIAEPADDDQPSPKKPPATKAVPRPAPSPLSKPTTAPKPAAAPAPKTSDLPAPVPLRGSDLRTADGVMLHATYYPGTQGKETVPIILLHSWKGSRSEFATLAPFLQQQGHAVLVPDLRGHGESSQINGRPVDPAKFTADQFVAMVQFDMETLKKFLQQKNNRGELNLERLCLVGSEMGAAVALTWARDDWRWPSYPGLKQGQFVKALVLLSPRWQFPGLPASAALAHPAVRSQLSVYVLVGKDNSKALAEAQRLHGFLERYHPVPPKEQELAKKDLYFKSFNTKLQGTQMLGNADLNVESYIAKFIEMRLVKQDFPWQELGKRAAVGE